MNSRNTLETYMKDERTRSMPDRISTMETDGRVDRAIQRGSMIEISVDDQPLRAYEGETVAAALLAVGRRVLRSTARWGEPRGVYCGIGSCFECVMTVDGQPSVRACQTLVRHGMRIGFQEGEGLWRNEP